MVTMKNWLNVFLEKMKGEWDKDFRKRALIFLVVLLAQMLILMRVALIGVGFAAYHAFWLVLIMDFAGFALRATTNFRANPVIAYAPATIFTFGAAMQSTLAMYRRFYEQRIDDLVVFHVLLAMAAFAALFATYNLIVRALKVRCVLWIPVVLSIGVYFLTLAFGKTDNAATLSLFGFQLHELVKVAFVFVMGSIFAAERLSEPAKIGLSFTFFSVCSALLVLMNEFGTLLVFLVAYIVALIAVADMKGVVYSIKKPFRNPRTKKIVLIFFGVLILACVIFYKPVVDKLEKLWNIVEDKYNDRVLPWLGFSVNEHKDAIAVAVKRGGLFGISSIREMAYVPVVRMDASYAMIAQLFGQVGGLILVGIYVTFGFCGLLSAHKLQDPRDRAYASIAAIVISSQALVSIGSAVGLLPLIGVTTPLVSSGGMGYVCQFLLIAIIARSHFNYCRDKSYTELEKAEALQAAERKADIVENVAELKVKTAAILKGRKLYVGLLWCVVVVGGLLLVGLAAANSYINHKYALVEVVELDRSDWQDEPAQEVSHIKLASEPYVRNILLLGVDYGENGRSDAIMMLSVNKRSNEVRLCSFQRDCYVEIPGKGKNKLNSAYSFGGAELVIKTIQNNFRVRIDEYAEIDMEGFIDMLSGMDSVRIKISEKEAEYINKHAGTTFKEGTVKMDANAALTYVRARKIDDDFGRAARQRKMIAAIGRELFGMVTNLKIAKADAALDTMADAVVTSMSANELKDLLPSMLLGMKEMLSGDDLRSQSIPYGKHYENIIVNGADCLEPQLEINSDYLYEYIYG